jgi:hypothetical protein
MLYVMLLIFFSPSFFLLDGIGILYYVQKEKIANVGYWKGVAFCFISAFLAFVVPIILTDSFEVHRFTPETLFAKVLLVVLTGAILGYPPALMGGILAHVQERFLNVYPHNNLVKRMLVYVPYFFIGYFSISFLAAPNMIVSHSSIYRISMIFRYYSPIFFAVSYIAFLIVTIRDQRKLNDG